MLRWEGHLFVAADPTGGHIYSLDEATGRLEWRFGTSAGVSSDLLISHERLIAVTLDNELLALDATSGSLQWKASGVPGVRGLAPTSPTPVLLDDTIFWARKDGVLSLRNLDDGEVLWSDSLGTTVSTDALRLQNAVLIGTADARLIAIDPHDGRLLAQNGLEGIPSYRWFEADGMLVGMTGVAGIDRRVVGVRAGSLDLVWSVAAPQDAEWTTAQPCIDGDLVLVGSSAFLVHALDVRTGAVRWTAPVDQKPRVITATRRHLYVGSADGSLTAYRR